MIHHLFSMPAHGPHASPSPSIPQVVTTATSHGMSGLLVLIATVACCGIVAVWVMAVAQQSRLRSEARPQVVEAVPAPANMSRARTEVIPKYIGRSRPAPRPAGPGTVVQPHPQLALPAGPRRPSPSPAAASATLTETRVDLRMPVHRGQWPNPHAARAGQEGRHTPEAVAARKAARTGASA